LVRVAAVRIGLVRKVLDQAPARPAVGNTKDVGDVGTVERTLETVRVTSCGTGSPPFAVLTRVAHVFCGPESGNVWDRVRRELADGTVATGDLVLLRVGGGAAEEWTEVSVTG
jgi:hypothetical protein